MKTFLRILPAAFALFAVAPVVIQAQNLPSIQANMGKRLPEIDKLKESGALGENNQGYLEVRENKDNAAAVAAAENADRKAVYEAIAAKQKVPVEEVGKARARQIAQQSKGGVWVQDAKGNWAKK
jgi:uncharacterized protein YdbL (DUF1318 family)